MRLPVHVAEALVAHARACAPAECCGMVAGDAQGARAIHRARNVSPDPRRYAMDPLEQMAIRDRIARVGLEVVAIYHSHPHSPAVPSATDVANAFTGRTPHLIVSLLTPDAPQLRAFVIDRREPADARVHEIPVSVTVRGG